MRAGSDDEFGFGVVFAEGFGGAAFFAFEDAVEIGDVVEATFEADFGDGLCGVDELAGGVADAHVDDVVGECASGTQLEEAAEGGGGHAGQGSHVVEVDGPCIVAVDGFLHLEYAPGVAGGMDVGEGCGGKQMVVGSDAEKIHDLEQAKHAYETRLRLGEVVETVVDFHDGGQMEGDAGLGVGQEGAEATHLGLAEEGTVEEVGGELYGDFAHVGGIAMMVFPTVLYVGAEEDEVVGIDLFDTVADDAACTVAVADEIELVFLVAVDGVVEVGFVAVDEIEAIAVAQGGDFGDGVAHGRSVVLYCKDSGIEAYRQEQMILFYLYVDNY